MRPTTSLAVEALDLGGRRLVTGHRWVAQSPLVLGAAQGLEAQVAEAASQMAPLPSTMVMKCPCAAPPSLRGQYA